MNPRSTLSSLFRPSRPGSDGLPTGVARRARLALAGLSLGCLMAAAVPAAWAAGSATAVTHDGKGRSDQVRIDFAGDRLRIESDSKSGMFRVTFEAP